MIAVTIRLHADCATQKSVISAELRRRHYGHDTVEMPYEAALLRMAQIAYAVRLMRLSFWRFHLRFNVYVVTAHCHFR